MLLSTINELTEPGKSFGENLFRGVAITVIAAAFTCCCVGVVLFKLQVDVAPGDWSAGSFMLFSCGLFIGLGSVGAYTTARAVALVRNPFPRSSLIHDAAPPSRREN